MLCAQGLLRELLNELEGQDPRRVQVLRAYGEQLAERDRAEDSAVAFLAAGDLDRSLQQYRLAGQWHMALCLAGELRRGHPFLSPARGKMVLLLPNTVYAHNFADTMHGL